MLTLDTYTFSSALPESFTIETEQDEDHVEVDIFLDGQTAYSTRLYANSAGVCTFYELRSIVEQYMIAQFHTRMAVNSLKTSTSSSLGTSMSTLIRLTSWSPISLLAALLM